MVRGGRWCSGVEPGGGWEVCCGALGGMVEEGERDGGGLTGWEEVGVVWMVGEVGEACG